MKPATDAALAFLLTLAGLSAAFVVYSLCRIAALYIRGWWDNRREARALKENEEAHGYSDAGRPRVSPRVLGPSYARAVDAARSHRGAQVHDHATGKAQAGPTHMAAVRTHLHQPTTRGVTGISDESGLGYALPRVGGDGDRAA